MGLATRRNRITQPSPCTHRGPHTVLLPRSRRRRTLGIDHPRATLPLQHDGGPRMDRIVDVASSRAGRLLARYMTARRRFKQHAEPPGKPDRLASQISQGKRVFDEIWIEPEADRPIVQDGKADNFRRAIIHEHYNAMPSWEPQILAAWRNYVLKDGPMPRTPEPRRPT
jgi:hypothetical protein